MRQNDASGFTLIELMTGLAVVAILTVLALPGYQALPGRGLREASLSALAADIRLARSTAITRNRAVVLCKRHQTLCTTDGGWEQGWLIYVDQGRSGVKDDTDAVIRQQTGWGHGLTLRGNTPVRNRIRFRPDGALSGISGAIVACDTRMGNYATNRAEARILIIATTGRLRTVRGDEYSSITGCEAL